MTGLSPSSTHQPFGADMLWLDSTYPTNSTDPGAKRGTCPITSGKPDDVESNHPDAHVTYSNIKCARIRPVQLDRTLASLSHGLLSIRFAEMIFLA